MSDEKDEYYWDRTHDWELHRTCYDVATITVCFRESVPDVAELAALRRALPEFRHVAPAALRARLGSKGELTLEEMSRREAIPIVAALKEQGLNVVEAGETQVTYLPIDRTIGCVWIIDDDEIAAQVAREMLAEGVRVVAAEG